MRKSLLIFLIINMIVNPLGVVRAQSVDPLLEGVQKGAADYVRTFRSKQKPSTDDEKIGVGSIPVGGPGQQGGIYYSIHLLGNVNRPGTYKVLPSDRITDAIKYGGGVAKNGSERMVQLRRQGTTRSLDLFSYKFNGNLSQNPYLTENDVIFVPTKKGEFGVEGPVSRPGSYELIRPISLSKAIEMAGGFTVGRSLMDPIRILRFDKDEKKQIIEVDNSNESMEHFNIERGDFVIIPHVLITNKKFDYNLSQLPGDNIFYPTINNNVYVIGAVYKPGPYMFEPTFSVSNYISQAGPTDTASVRRPKIIGFDGKKKTAKKTTQVNPGDTIVVPTKVVTTSNFIGWFGTLTSMALTTFIFIDRFK